jgi:hypothetical protein
MTASTATLPDPTDGRAECARCNAHIALRLDDGPVRVGEQVRAWVKAHGDHAGVSITTPGPRTKIKHTGTHACGWCGPRCGRSLRDSDGDPSCAGCAKSEAAE